MNDIGINNHPVPVPPGRSPKQQLKLTLLPHPLAAQWTLPTAAFTTIYDDNLDILEIQVAVVCGII